MDHLEAIVELKNIIHNDTLKKLKFLCDKKCKKNLMIESKKIIKDVRNVKGYHLDFKYPTDIFYYNYIKKEIERIYSLYKVKFPFLETISINQIDLLKYGKGQKYDVHIDYIKSMKRNLSIIINLNDNYEGGDLVFTDQKENEIKRIKLNKGSVVFFPSNFMYPHKIEPIVKGIRYSIVLWLQ